MGSAVLVQESSVTEEAVDWARMPLAARVAILRRARHSFAERAAALADAISPQLVRTRADTLVAEVLPLLEACRFLEKNASSILQTRALNRKGRPFWLGRVASFVQRVPLGKVLIIAPSNYPLFLAGTQALQALAAGNNVVWKPGAGGAPVAALFLEIMLAAGLPPGTLRVTDDTVDAGISELQRGADKIIFTGSSEAGAEILRSAAQNATPVIAELSGCDSVVVLPGADLNRVLDALEFGLRLNGSATCMAPRRLILVGEQPAEFTTRLRDRLARMPAIALHPHTREKLRLLLEDATEKGAIICGDFSDVTTTPMLILAGKPSMKIAQADVFAPVLTVLTAADEDEVVALEAASPFGLTTSIFGAEKNARALGHRLVAGTVLINDLIIPTADPRVPFGGRRRSGFGVTRGAEGLLEMTAIKTVLVQRGKGRQQFQSTTQAHEPMFLGLIALTHSQKTAARLLGLKAMVAAAIKLREKK